jgi:phenylacetic acid degradation operon negative regulatory protein
MPAARETATEALLRRFRSQRPVRGGSLIVTIFGDSIAPRGGVVTLGSLIQLAEPFGLTERLVRTSVARLAQDGWLVARRDGRRSEYRLTPNGEQRFAEATQRIYSNSPALWDGRWTLLVLAPSAAKRPDTLRDELRWLGFGQVSPGVFAHPNSDLEQARKWLRSLNMDSSALLLQSSSEGAIADCSLVAAGWDLGQLARRYRGFVDSFTSVAAGSGPGAPRPASAFVIRPLLIHEYRKIHLRDPLLPQALLPADWVGSRAYELCSGLYARVFGAAEDFLSMKASTLNNPLPAAHASTYGRFGGISAWPG